MTEVVLSVVLSAVTLIAHVAIIVAVLLAERKHPSATLAWLLTLVFLPFVGLLLYLAIGMTRARRVARRAQQSSEQLDAVLRRHAVHDRMDPDAPWSDPRTPGFLALGRRIASTPASVGNDVRPLVNAAAAYRAMIEAIEAAEQHVHVEFFIVRDDRTGRSLRDRLARRAAAGVKVRVVVDAVGSGRLPSDFWRPLVEAGGEAAWFHPVSRWFARLRRRDRVDFRNHRKIVVVDGRVGFTGGINIGREYLGLDPDMGHWRDTHVQIEGPAVLGLQAAFLEDWFTATGDLVDDGACFPDPGSAGSCVVQIVDSGPDRRWSSITHAFLQAYGSARERLWITSPYFIPSPEILETLVTAALRGVDVRLLLPAKADHLLVHLASKSYYRRLLDAGIRVFLYESVGWRYRRRRHRGRGFIHAKTLVVDSWLATIGSANMDMRSFELNFELNAFVLGAEFAEEMADQFLEDSKDAQEETLEDLDTWSLPQRLVYQLARLTSPLL